MNPAARRFLVIIFVAFVTIPVATQPADPILSPRNANYTMSVQLDPETKILTATQRLEWRNIQSVATDELWFHLYWNGWRNSESTWMIEDRLRRRSDRETGETKEGDWSWITIDAVHLVDTAGNQIDLAPTQRSETPDDDNTEDRTVWVVTLPEPVNPGETVTVDLIWRAKIPRTFARTGFRGDFFFLAHWFPKLGVFEGEAGWNCHQYHASTEYFSDYGVYDVTITTPSSYVIGATGREIETVDHGDGTTSHRFRQADVHGFAWTASPDYVEVRDRFEHPDLPAVDIRLLMQPEHEHQTQRHLDATKAALEHYGLWYGAYPYGHVTVIDPAWGSGAGGMEYPTLFTCGTGIDRPFGAGSPEGVTVHEAGHQFWYGIVGNNEFEYAWLDEGLNTYSTIRTMQETYGNSFIVRRYLAPSDARGIFALAFPEIRNDPWMGRLNRYRDDARSDVQNTPTFRYHPKTGGSLSYSKTALWLRTLENYLGWETFQPIMAAFFERYAFKHPTPEDFVAVANEVSGRDLNWFFDQVIYDSVAFDYAIDSVSSKPVGLKGLTGDDGDPVYVDPKDDDEEEDEEKSWRTDVVVRRHGGGRFPVQVKMVFENGDESIHEWDGQDRWTIFSEEHGSKLSYVVVDPEGVLALDIHPNNNSLFLEAPSKKGAVKWASFWMVWVQDLMSSWAFYI
ncbi:MAG: M1 family peptidase [Acidobacteria bacterium]|nr:MAG: M1 family peptidase [Acidobacteriota bacterium]